MANINYNFRNPELLDLALTQSGANAEHNNERLEFIGDRVLGLSVAALLYEMFPNEREGELARRHAMLVSTETLARVAHMLGVDRHVRHGHMTAGRTQHICANAMEAVFGAIFLDGGFDVARDIIVGIWRDLASMDVVAPKDAKTALQECAVEDFVSAFQEKRIALYKAIVQNNPSQQVFLKGWLNRVDSTSKDLAYV